MQCALSPHLLPSLDDTSIDYLDMALDACLGVGGAQAKALQALGARYPLVFQSESLSLGGPGLLDQKLLRDFRVFLQTHRALALTEPLAWTADDSLLFAALPIPSTAEAVAWTAARIVQAQAAIGCPIGVANVVHHLIPPGAEMSEPEFVTQVVELANCQLHLDLTALHLNSQYFGFDALAFLDALPLARVTLVRVSGCIDNAQGHLRRDAHGPIPSVLWDLLDHVYDRVGRQVATSVSFNNVVRLKEVAA